MSDTGATPDFQQLYQQVLAQFPRSKGKTASPQADLKASLAWKKMIDDQLGFDPANYQSPEKQPYSPKSSVVRTQWASDPNVIDALDLVDEGQSSNSIAKLLIDPATGEATQGATDRGIDTATATSAIKAAQEYEKEKATNTSAQADYEARQAADPTYGRTKGSTNGKQVLPEGDLNGMEIPTFAYSQALQDHVQGLSTKGEVKMPARPEIHGHPYQEMGQIATVQRPDGGMQVDTAIHGAGLHGGGGLAAGAGRTMTPIMQQATGDYANHGFNPLSQLANTARSLVPTIGPSAQERATTALQGYQKFGQNYLQPVHSQANNAAVQKLLQIMALQQG